MSRRKAPLSAPWITRWSYVEVTVITFDTPHTFSSSAGTPSMPGGQVMPPVATMVPCPFMSLGTDALVPNPPGLVNVTPAPRNSSGLILPTRERWMRSSNAARKPWKPSAAQSRITGTSSERLPSLRSTSTAMPRSTVSRGILLGFPSTRANAVAITGVRSTARTIAQAMMCVNDSLPAPATARASFRRLRSASSTCTEMVRNVVAVGMDRLSSM